MLTTLCNYTIAVVVYAGCYESDKIKNNYTNTNAQVNYSKEIQKKQVTLIKQQLLVIKKQQQQL